MISFRKLRRTGAAGLAFAGLAFIGSASPALAQENDYGCNQYALAVCSYDGSGRPIELTYECFIAEYNACIAFHEGGGLAYSIDYLRDRA